MCDDTSTLQALSLAELRSVEARLSKSAPPRLKSELSKYCRTLEQEQAKFTRAAMKQTPEELADHSIFIGQLADAYGTTSLGEGLARLAQVVESEQQERKAPMTITPESFAESASPASKGNPLS